MRKMSANNNIVNTAKRFFCISSRRMNTTMQMIGTDDLNKLPTNRILTQ